jgi:hypothetical protein
MVFWIAVVIGGIFAWAAVQVGFFASWIMLFNMVLSAYLAIFLGPLILDSVPATTDTPYGYALVLLTVGIATLVTAYAICYTCLSGRLRVEFPGMFDSIAAGFLGFLAGFLVSSFVGFAVSLTPLPEMDSLKPLGLDASSQRATRSYLCWWCDVLHGFVGSSDSSVTSAEAVALLLERVSPPPEESPQPRARQPSADRKTGTPQSAVDPKAGTPAEKTGTPQMPADRKFGTYPAPVDRKSSFQQAPNQENR